MGILDRLFGRAPARDASTGGPAYGPAPSGAPEPGTPAWGTPPRSYPPEPGAPSSSGPPGNQASRDEEAIRRYRYLLRTAPPEAVEQAHAEAFAQLTPDQRRQVLGQLANHVPEYERVTDDDPRTLARMATRAEMRQPGFLERVFGGGYGPGYGGGYGRGYGGGGMMGGGFGMGGGMGMGGMIAGGLLASVAGSFIGTAIAEEMFDHNDYMSSGFADPNGSSVDFDNNQVDTSGVDDRNLADGGYADPGSDPGADPGGSGDSFGDFGGGDFGGGDLGGGDNSW